MIKHGTYLGWICLGQRTVGPTRSSGGSTAESIEGTYQRDRNRCACKDNRKKNSPKCLGKPWCPLCCFLRRLWSPDVPAPARPGTAAAAAAPDGPAAEAILVQTLAVSLKRVKSVCATSVTCLTCSGARHNLCVWGECPFLLALVVISLKSRSSILSSSTSSTISASSLPTSSINVVNIIRKVIKLT